MFRIVLFCLWSLGTWISAQPPSYGAVIERSLFQEELLFPLIIEDGVDQHSSIYYALISTLELLSNFELEEMRRQDLGLDSKYPAAYLSQSILDLQASKTLEATPISILNKISLDSLNNTLLNLPSDQQAEIGEVVFSLKFIQKEWKVHQERKQRGLVIDGKKEIDILLNYLRVFEEFVNHVEKKPALQN